METKTITKAKQQAGTMMMKPDFEVAPDAIKKQQISEHRDYYVAQHNDFIQKQRFAEERGSGKSLTLTEEKILSYLISQIKPHTTHLEPMTFDIRMFCEVCGLGKGNKETCYHQVKSAVKQLSERVMWLRSDDGSETTVRYISRARMYRGKGQITIEFDDMMEPFLLNLAGKYFQFSLHNILAMKSKYSIQLYKLLKSYYFQCPSIRFEIKMLKEILDATHYTRFSDFKDRVLMPGLCEINKYTDLSVDVKFEKEGRTVSYVLFSMTNLENVNSQEEVAEAQKRYYNVERVIEPGFYL